MEETISTTVEAPQEQTTPDVEETTQPVEEQTIEEATQEPDKVAEETTESVEGEETPKVEQAKNWEQIAKDNQASFTRVSQELAELKKQIADNKPKLVQEGKINPEFEQKYKFDVDNREFLAYDKNLLIHCFYI